MDIGNAVAVKVLRLADQIDEVRDGFSELVGGLRARFSLCSGGQRRDENISKRNKVTSREGEVGR